MRLNVAMSRLISSGSPLLPMAEAGEIAGPGPQVVEAGVLLGGAGPGPGLAGHVGGESRADHRPARRRFEYRLASRTRRSSFGLRWYDSDFKALIAL